MSTLSARITAANEEALRRIAAAAPVLTGVRTARDVIPALAGRTMLHAGPPIAATDLCGPMRGAILGAACFEGWTRTPDEASALLDSGAISLQSAHDHAAVGPMAGVITASMPVLEVIDREHGAMAFCPINEGLGAVLRFGAYGPEVVARLQWMAGALGPALDRALREMRGVPLIPIMARALAMGDEMHQRNIAATALLTRMLAPALADLHLPAGELAGVMRFLAANDQFFLNVAMAAAKCILDAVGEIPYATVVTAMSRNGVEFGIRLSGLGRQWITAPAPAPDGLYFPGHQAEDANLDMGDSAIIETVGLGGFAMAAAPALVGFLGLGSTQEAVRATRAMAEITLGRSPHWLVPGLDFEGVPTGIDIRRVVELEIAPLINTGIAHRRAGVGQIGAGVVRAPLACFQQALAAFAERYAA